MDMVDTDDTDIDPTEEEEERERLVEEVEREGDMC